MRKFNIIRYLKRWWPLIALMSILAGAFFMRYASNNQAYTAQAVIKYTYDAVSEGLTPNGEPLDVSEIFSSTVVKEAIERLGYSVNVDTIRSGGTVTGITPAEVQTRQDALADDHNLGIRVEIFKVARSFKLLEAQQDVAGTQRNRGRTDFRAKAHVAHDAAAALGHAVNLGLLDVEARLQHDFA